MNYIIDCEEYGLEKKQLVLMAFNRLDLNPLLYGIPYKGEIKVTLETTYQITNDDYTSWIVCSSFDQLMKDSGLPFREDGEESYDLSGIEELVVNRLLPKSEKDCIVASYTLTLTEEDFNNIYKGVKNGNIKKVT